MTEAYKEFRNVMFRCNESLVSADFDLDNVPIDGESISSICPINRGKIVTKFTKEVDRVIKVEINCNCEVYIWRRMDG